MDDPFDDNNQGNERRQDLYDEYGDAIPPRGSAALEDYVVHKPRSRRTGHAKPRVSVSPAKRESRGPDVASTEAFPPLASSNTATNTTGVTKKPSEATPTNESPTSQQTPGSQPSASTESRGGLYTFGFHEKDRFPVNNKGGDFHISVATDKNVFVYQFDVQKQGWFPISLVTEHDTAAFKQEIDAITALKQRKDFEGKSDGAADRQLLSLVGKLGQSCSGSVPAVPGGGLASQSSNIRILTSPLRERLAKAEANPPMTLAERSAERRALIEERSRNSPAAIEFKNTSPKIPSPSYTNYLQQFASSPQRVASAGQRTRSVSNLTRIDERAEETSEAAQGYTGSMHNNPNPSNGRFPSAQEIAAGSPSRESSQHAIGQPMIAQHSPYGQLIPSQQSQFNLAGATQHSQFRQPLPIHQSQFTQPLHSQQTQFGPPIPPRMNQFSQPLIQQPAIQQYLARQPVLPSHQGQSRHQISFQQPQVQASPGLSSHAQSRGQTQLPTDSHSMTTVTPTKRQQSASVENHPNQYGNSSIMDGSSFSAFPSTLNGLTQSVQAQGWYASKRQTEEEYKAELEKFWNSGKKPFDDLQGRVTESIVANEPNISPAREASLRLLTSAHATFQAYAHPRWTRDEDGNPKPLIDSITRGSPIRPQPPPESELTPRPGPAYPGFGPVAPFVHPNWPRDQTPLPYLGRDPLGIPRHARMGRTDPTPPPHHNCPPTPVPTGAQIVQKRDCAHTNVTVGGWCGVCLAWVVPNTAE